MSAWFARVLSLPGRAAVACCVALVQLYRLTISPWLGPACRFQPTCSVYMIESLRKYGFFVGVWRGFLRICRCHPWGPHGYDPP